MKIKFSVFKSIIDNTKYQISMWIDKPDVSYLAYNVWFDSSIDIAKVLELDIDFYYEFAKKYGAIVEYNKYIHKKIVLFNTKNDARYFIKKGLMERIIPLFKMSKI